MAGLALSPKPVQALPGLPPIQQLGPFHFVDATDFATNLMTVTGEGAVFRPQFASQGYESGGAHYIWDFMWPFNNPGETTVDVGMVADLWVRPDKWAIWFGNDDYALKVVAIQDTQGHVAVVDLATTAFLEVTQV